MHLRYMRKRQTLAAGCSSVDHSSPLMSNPVKFNKNVETKKPSTLRSSDS